MWSPDGSRLLFHRSLDQGRAGEIWEVDLPSAPPRKIGDGNDPAWAPDNRRVAYVTIPPSSGRRKSLLRLVNYHGENGWAPVRDIPPDAPSVGIPNKQRPPSEWHHVLASPLWDAAGKSVYLIALIGMELETDFGIWERADMHAGGSAFVAPLVNVVAAVASPDRHTVVLIHSTARGDTFFSGQTLEGSPAAEWLNTEAGFRDDAPAWAPDSAALAYYHCPLDLHGCDIVVRTPRGVEPLLRGADLPADLRTIPSPLLDWAPEP
ncbi:MAG: hypothetical protein NVSMB42_07350 [Herpetosiphon sp.]